MQQATRRKAGLQAADQLVGIVALVGADRVDVPFLIVAVVGGNKGRLTAHGQANIAGLQLCLDGIASHLNVAPFFARIGASNARRFLQPGYLHIEVEGDLGIAAEGTADRRGALRGWRGGERNMALTGEQAGGGIKPDPAGTRHIDFGPCVQIGEVGFRTIGTIGGFEVGLQLDQVAGDKAGGITQMAQHLDEQPGTVTAGAFLTRQGLFRRLNARFHPHDVADPLVQHGVEVDEEINGAARGQIDIGHQLFQQRAVLGYLEIGGQFLARAIIIGEGDVMGAFLKEEIERVDGIHAGDQIDCHLKQPGMFWKHQPRHEVAERVLLPVDEVFDRLDLLGIAQDRGSAMGRGPEADNLWSELDGAVIAIGCAVG